MYLSKSVVAQAPFLLLSTIVAAVSQATEGSLGETVALKQEHSRYIVKFSEKGFAKYKRDDGASVSEFTCLCLEQNLTEDERILLSSM